MPMTFGSNKRADAVTVEPDGEDVPTAADQPGSVTPDAVGDQNEPPGGYDGWLLDRPDFTADVGDVIQLGDITIGRDGITQGNAHVRMRPADLRYQAAQLMVAADYLENEPDITSIEQVASAIEEGDPQIRELYASFAPEDIARIVCRAFDVTPKEPQP